MSTVEFCNSCFVSKSRRLHAPASHTTYAAPSCCCFHYYIAFVDALYNTILDYIIQSLTITPLRILVALPFPPYHLITNINFNYEALGV